MRRTRRARPPRRTRRRGSIALGIVLLLAGVGFLGYGGWEVYGTTYVARQRADTIRKQTVADWKQGKPGPAQAILRIPRFGNDFVVPIVKGFDDATLAKGVAEYPRGARPGAVGNVVIAGHRVTHGEPFKAFPDLRPGDRVILDTRTARYTYRLRNSGTSVIVDFNTSWPLWPVPDPKARDRRPRQRLITLLTCSELFHTDNRSVVVGDLVSRVPYTA